MLILFVTAIIGFIIALSCVVAKRVELEEPMEIIVARRICNLRIEKNKKECKIKELEFVKNKHNRESHSVRIQALRIELIYIQREIEKLKSYGKV